MYLDFSLRKTVAVASTVLVLVLFVYATYAAKMHAFGSTPFFYTINVGSKYLFQSLLASVSRNSLFAGAAASQSSTAQASSIPVLTYHRIVEDSNDVNNVTVSRFRSQMEALKDAGWETVSLDEFEAFMRGEKELPEKSFLLTFDDGAKQSFYPVDPILRELGYEASIFIIVQSSKTAESTYYMTPEEIRMMLKTGRWSIGSHSYDGHRPYGVDRSGATGIFFADRIWNKEAERLETPEEFTARVKDDLTRSKAELEATYNLPIRTLAFPLGNETGIQGANNFADGASITQDEASAIYDWGFVQTNGQTYTFNFPKMATPSFNPPFATTSERLSADFLVHRIHVDYDWDGARILSIMENGLAKPLPYEDNFSEDHGWISAWGSMEIGRNNLVIGADPSITSASVFLDGTALWRDYSFDASVNWTGSHVSLLADVLDSKTYHSCAFSEGVVRLQRTVSGETTTLIEKKDPRITYGTDVHPGIRVRGNVIECTWEFASIIEDYSRDFSGGAGIQIWDPVPGTARLQIASIIARSL
jgi:peptidoglycan/xylan/chitin deacetylase (PgdA/CDA1 family)